MDAFCSTTTNKVNSNTNADQNDDIIDGNLKGKRLRLRSDHNAGQKDVFDVDLNTGHTIIAKKLRTSRWFVSISKIITEEFFEEGIYCHSNPEFSTRTRLDGGLTFGKGSKLLI